jgi:hypothetical protein
MLKAHEPSGRAIAALTVEMNKPRIAASVALADTNAVDAVADSQKPARRKAGRRRKQGYWKRFICKESADRTGDE